jgi:hypothetical protein
MLDLRLSTLGCKRQIVGGQRAPQHSLEPRLDQERTVRPIVDHDQGVARRR